jgi:hypothetical protein
MRFGAAAPAISAKIFCGAIERRNIDARRSNSFRRNGSFVQGPLIRSPQGNLDKERILKNILSLVVILALTACSADERAPMSATGDTQKRDACSMLTAAAVSSAIGKTVGEGRKTNEIGGGENQGHMTTCTWETLSTTEGVSVAETMRNQASAVLILWSWPSEEGGASYLESFRKVARETGEPEPIPLPLGQAAIKDGASVHVHQGNATFSIAVQVYGDADQAAAGKASETLAGQVVAKL